VGGPEGVEELLGVALARRAGAGEPAVAGQGEGVLDGHPAGHQVAEQLGDAVDVAGPVVAAGPGVEQTALVVGEPAGQDGVEQRGPHLDAGRPGRAQDGGQVLDRRAVHGARPGLDAGPLDAEAVVAQAVLGQHGPVALVVGGEAVALARPGRPVLGLPARPGAGRGGTLGVHGVRRGPPAEVVSDRLRHARHASGDAGHRPPP
jgi:hypothetical protein